MADRETIQDSHGLGGMRWSPMVGISILFHLAIFLVVLFVPEAMPKKPFEGIIYQVNLVEMPGRTDIRLGAGKAVTTKKGKGIVSKDTKAKRIGSVRKKEKPLVIAKRSVKPKETKTTKPKVSSSKMIDRAISKIETKVKTEEKVKTENKEKAEDTSHIDRAISKLEKEAVGRYGTGPTEGGPAGGIPIQIQIYRSEVEDRIYSNWSYPVALGSKKDLQAIIVLTVKRDGTIKGIEIKKRSSDPIFDQSVIKAIEKSAPLPPFPRGYRRSYEEIEINFDLSDLESS